VKGESLKDYASRLFKATKLPDDYNLLGVSFGGMIAAEFAKIKQPRNLFLVSTVSNSSEMPLQFRFGKLIPLHKITPTFLLKSANFITYYLFGVKTQEDKQLLSQILKDTDPDFLRWAMNAMLHWNNTVKQGIKIHGSKDRMLPAKGKIDYLVDQGGHFMIVNKADEIQAIVQSILRNH
jgi:pimeloyl-ACP methyl ester carboxylesterase